MNASMRGESRLAVVWQLLNRITATHLAIGQGGYFLITGIWPLVSMRTFLMITGPKVDLWLVNTVGLLLAVNGAVLITAGIRRRISQEIWLLAVGSAAALTAIEVVYVSKGRISPIYLLDALVEMVLIALWVIVRLRGGVSSTWEGMKEPSPPLRGRGPG